MATRGGEVQEIRPGDVVYIEPGEEHWHGATPDRFMAHVAMQEADENGDIVTWLDHVTDTEYGIERHRVRRFLARVWPVAPNFRPALASRRGGVDFET